VANRRIVTLGFFLALTWLFMLSRVFHVQVLESTGYQDLAASQSVRRDVLLPRRGEIFDRQMNQLAVNADLKLGEDGRGRDWTLSRVCPNGALAGQVLGNVGRDGFGQAGLELANDKVLRGSDGWRYARHDVRNRYYPEFDPRAEHAVDGRDVVLTLDLPLQAIVEQALERGVLRVGAKRGTAIFVEPKTGDLLAIANYPFYNPNMRGSEANQAWKNLSVSMQYEPGSTFKVIATAALLEEHAISPEDTLDGEQGQWSLAGQIIRDTHPYGRICFRDALAFSSNICFAKAGGLVSRPSFYRYLRSFGFGMKTGVALPAEESGSLKSVSDWSGRTQQTLAFGHEISVTPLQLVMAVSAIANDGVLMRPRIVKGYRDGLSNDFEENPPRKVRQVVSAKTAQQVREMMRAVVEYGTAAEIRRGDLSMAGKTGTAEKIDPETGKYLPGSFHSSFIGLAPSDQPTLVGLVMVDEPSQFKYGGQCAAPIFREIIDRLAVMPNPVVAMPLQAPSPSQEPESPKWADSRIETAEFQNVALGLNEESQSARDSVWVPDLRGVSLEVAKMRLEKAGLAWEAEGVGSKILVQDPPPGARVFKDQAIRVSLGEFRPGSMPDLHRATLRDALLKLRSLELKVEYRGNGRVIKQIPEPGAAVRPGQTITLELGWVG
jgi:cell division protein FtsI/penicillin-binding protein 2